MTAVEYVAVRGELYAVRKPLGQIEALDARAPADLSEAGGEPGRRDGFERIVGRVSLLCYRGGFFCLQIRELSGLGCARGSVHRDAHVSQRTNARHWAPAGKIILAQNNPCRITFASRMGNAGWLQLNLLASKLSGFGLAGASTRSYLFTASSEIQEVPGKVSRSS